MTKQAKTLDEMATNFLEFLGGMESTDALREAGVSEKTVLNIEATMRSKGLDPERPEDLQAMFVHMIDKIYLGLAN